MIFSQDRQRETEAILAVGSGSSTLALSYAVWGVTFPPLGDQGPCAGGLIENVLAAGPQEQSLLLQGPTMCAGLRRLSQSPQCPFLLVEAWDKWLSGHREKTGCCNK